MKRRLFVGGALAGLSTTGTFAKPQKVKAGDIPTTTFGKTGVKVSVIAQGGARMDLHPDVQTAAAHVRKVYDLGVTYFDCARAYWNGRSEEAYGIGLQGIRKNVFLTTKTMGRNAKEVEQDLDTSLRLLKTDYVDLWQVHMAVEHGVGIQAIKVFGKAFLLRSLSPTECLRYALSQPSVHVAICGAGTQGQMEDNIRTVQNFKKMTPEEIADVQKKSLVGQGVYAGVTMEYWKKKS